MGEVVLVTGGTQGIGLGLARAFIAQGADVAVCGRSEVPLVAFRREFPSALAVKADVTIADDRAAMLKSVSDRFGRIDVLVNNAGRFVERDFLKSDALEGLEDEVALNLTAPISLTGEVLKLWPNLRSVIFVSSGFALVPPARAPTYGAVKAGLHGFAEGLRQQLSPNGTHVLELLPTSTDTPGTATDTRKKMTTTEVAKTTLKALAKKKPMALPGPMRFLPMLLRIAPAATTRMVARSHGRAEP